MYLILRENIIGVPQSEVQLKYAYVLVNKIMVHVERWKS